LAIVNLESILQQQSHANLYYTFSAAMAYTLLVETTTMISNKNNNQAINFLVSCTGPCCSTALDDCCFFFILLLASFSFVFMPLYLLVKMQSQKPYKKHIGSHVAKHHKWVHHDNLAFQVNYQDNHTFSVLEPLSVTQVTPFWRPLQKIPHSS